MSLKNKKRRVKLPAPEPAVGEYVLASKWSDGDPKDHWCVGFLVSTDLHTIEGHRYYVADGNGNMFRSGGFRRVKKISPARGEWLVANMSKIEMSGRSVWYFARCAMRA